MTCRTNARALFNASTVRSIPATIESLLRLILFGRSMRVHIVMYVFYISEKRFASCRLKAWRSRPGENNVRRNVRSTVDLNLRFDPGPGRNDKNKLYMLFFICVLGSVIDFLGEPFNPQSLNILDAVNSDTGDTLNSLLLSVLWYYLPTVRDGEFVNLSDIIRNVGSEENVMNTMSLENVQNFTYTERSSVASFVPSPKLLTYREIRLSYVIKSPCCVLAFSSATKIWTIFKARWLQVFYVKNHP